MLGCNANGIARYKSLKKKKNKINPVMMNALFSTCVYVPVFVNPSKLGDLKYGFCEEATDKNNNNKKSNNNERINECPLLIRDH